MTWAIKDKSYSQRRACALVGLQAKTYRYASRRSDDAPIRHRLLELAQQRRRFGYRRLHLLLRREGVMLNHKKLYRLYREMGLQLRNKTPKRRVKAKLREDRKVATRPNGTPPPKAACTLDV